MQESGADLHRSDLPVPERKMVLVDVADCVLWPHHNRNFDRLNERNCQDILLSLKAEGAQVQAAAVRHNPGSGPKYEIVAGARRFWGINWIRENHDPTALFLVNDYGHLTDEQSFRLSNIENLARRDLSDYERALDYKYSLQAYYDGNQSSMARAIGLTESTLSRHLKLAKVPIQVANAFPEWSDLKSSHAPDLLKILDDEKHCQTLLQLATELQARHQAAEFSGVPVPTGAEVIKSLRAVGAEETTKFDSKPIKQYGPPENPHLDLKRSTGAGLSIFVPKSSGADIDVLVDSFRECLERYYKRQ